MFPSVSILWFVAAYSVVLGLECARVRFKLPVRLRMLLAGTLSGLVAHTIYLVTRMQGAVGGLPLSTWYDWLLVAAWIVVAAYLFLAITRPQTNVGVFLLPLVLGLIGLAYQFRLTPAFARDQAMASWAIAHGVSLLLGTVIVSLGFVAGVMYLVQSYRLKHKVPLGSGIRLPSLEWLQWINQQALFYSAFFVAMGVLAGIVLNAIKQRTQGQAVPWNDSVIVSSGLLLGWLLVATAFELAYKPAQQGRKVAYLTLASFVFVVLSLGMALASTSQHAALRGAARVKEARP